MSGKINIYWTFLELERRRTQFFLGSDDFLPFLFKIGQNSDADLSGSSTFSSALFDLYGRTIGQLATLLLFFVCSRAQEADLYFKTYI